MGGVVATANQQERARSEAIISLSRMSRHMRLFQHNNTGEVLVLVNQDIAGYLGPEFVNDWFEVSLSRLQESYLKKLNVLVSVPGKNTTYVEEAPGKPGDRQSPALEANISETAPNTINNSAIDNGAKTISSAPPMLSPRTANREVAAGKITESNNISPSAKDGSKQEPDVLKRLKVLKNAAMEGKSVSLDSSIEFSGSRHLTLDYTADAKPSRPHFKNNGEKSRSKNQLRSFIPTPYLPLGVTKAPDEMQLNSFSYNHGNNSFHGSAAKDVGPSTISVSNNEVLGQPNNRLKSNASAPTPSSRSLNVQSTPCPSCGMVYFGPNSHNALEEHQWSCYSHRELKSALDQINNLLRPSFQELIKHLKPLEATAPFYKQVVFLVSKVLQISANNADVDYAHRIGKHIEKEIINEEKYVDNLKVQDVKDKPAILTQFAFFQAILEQSLQQLRDKEHVLRNYSTYLSSMKDYQLLRVLGKGGFGVVYLAKRKWNKKLVAIKVINKEVIHNSSYETQIVRERKVMSEANHYPDYYVHLYTSFQDVINLYLVMEYVPGGDCMTLLTRLKIFPEMLTQHIIAQVSLAVRHLHLHGVVHRDIKPDNVMITSKGHAKLGDFGLVAPFYKDKGNGNSPNANPTGSGMMAGIGRAFTVSNTNTPRANPTPNNIPIGASPRASHNLPRKTSSNSFVDDGGVHAASNFSTPTSHTNNSSPQKHLWLAESSNTDSLYDTMKHGPGAQNSEAIDKSSIEESSSSIYFAKTGAQNLLNSRVGNYNYSCPEIVIGTGYDHTVDWWAVAIMTFHFLAGITPFEASTQEETLENIILYRANWDLLPETTSNECKDFMSKIISVKKSEERLGYEEGSMYSLNGSTILTHDFFADIDWYTLFDGYGPLYPDLPSNAGLVSQGSRRVISTTSATSSPRTTVATTVDSPNDKTLDSIQSSTTHHLDGLPIPCFSLLTEQEMQDLPDYVAMSKLHTEEQKEQQSSSQSSHHHIQNNQIYRKSHHHTNHKKTRNPDVRKQRHQTTNGTNRHRANSSSSGTPNDSEDEDHFNHIKHLHDGFEEFTFNS